MEDRVAAAPASTFNQLGSAGKTGRWPTAAIGLLLLGYVLSRVGSLTVLPVFLDEAVHLQWAERLWNEGRILKPVGAGRLLAVAAYGLAGLFEERLVAARTIAALAGAASLVFTILLARRLFGVAAGVVAGILYLLSPFALVYDRLALSDGFLTACLTGLLFASSNLIERPRSLTGLVLVSILVLLSVLSKVSALLFFTPLPLALFVPAREVGRSSRGMILAFALGLVLAAPMLWFFWKNSGEISAQHLSDPLVESGLVLSTLSDMREWAMRYFGPTALFLALLSLFVLRDGRALWMAGSVVVPFFLFALFSKPWSARYVLPTLPPFLILISGGLVALSARVKEPARTPVLIFLTALASVSGLAFTFQLLIDPAKAPFPNDDRHQLVSGWPAGYGMRQLSDRILREAAEGPITVFVDTGGTRALATSLPLLLGSTTQVYLIEGDFASAPVRAAMVETAARGRALAILGPRNPSLNFVEAFGGRVHRLEIATRPGGEWAGSLFALEPPPPGGAP